MKRQFRTLSAFMRHAWLIEPTYAEAYLPLVNSYLNGTLPQKMGFDDDENHDEQEADPLARCGYVVAATGDDDEARTPQTRFSLDDPELPENSVYVLDIRGPIFKESTCCSVGTEDLCTMVRRAYAHSHIIGVVCLIDSPGGQLSGTPTLYDVLRDPVKPTVSVVSEGLMASAAYWLACGSDYIYATQKTDQIGSIGVFVQLEDRTEQKKQMGVKTITVYSDRSPEKNKPYRDALAGDTKLLREDLNMAADLFREAVEDGRGKRLKVPAKNGPDVFKGGLFYAGKAIELGLIDGYGDLNSAVAKVAELAKAPKAEAVTDDTDDTDDEMLEELDEIEDAITDDDDDNPEQPDEQASLPPNSNQSSDMFGDKHKKLTALAGVEASAITDEQLNDINANLDEMNIKGARVISTAYLQEAQQAITGLATANQTIQTLTKERDEARQQAAAYGAQPGHMGSKSEKIDEPTGSTDDNASRYYSEVDQELDNRKAATKRPA